MSRKLAAVAAAILLTACVSQRTDLTEVRKGDRYHAPRR